MVRSVTTVFSCKSIFYCFKFSPSVGVCTYICITFWLVENMQKLIFFFFQLPEDLMKDYYLCLFVFLFSNSSLAIIYNPGGKMLYFWNPVSNFWHLRQLVHSVVLHSLLKYFLLALMPFLFFRKSGSHLRPPLAIVPLFYSARAAAAGIAFLGESFLPVLLPSGVGGGIQPLG